VTKSGAKAVVICGIWSPLDYPSHVVDACDATVSC
jgi:hypothetical protein